jgi:hypothetical protein
MLRRCFHCNRASGALSARGLCRHCNRLPNTRRLYPLLRDCLDPPPPERPAGALPGSVAKVLVMAARRAAGCGLWHPLDAHPAALPDEAGLLDLPDRPPCVMRLQGQL